MENILKNLDNNILCCHHRSTIISIAAAGAELEIAVEDLPPVLLKQVLHLAGSGVVLFLLSFQF